MEDEDQLRPVPLSSSKRTRTISSDEDETPDNKSRHRKGNTRSSERLQKRSNRSFQMPSRDKVWDSIEDQHVSPSKLRQLRPRKLVNNFVTGKNRYNYDKFESSGSESMDEFIVDDFEESDSSSSSGSGDCPDKQVSSTPSYKARKFQVVVSTSLIEQPSKSRVQNHHRRLTVGSDSDCDSGNGRDRDDDSGNSSHQRSSGSAEPSLDASHSPVIDSDDPESSVSSVGEGPDSPKSASPSEKGTGSRRRGPKSVDIDKKAGKNQRTVSDRLTLTKRVSSEEGTDSEEEISAAPIRHRSNIIESDDEDDADCGGDEDAAEGGNQAVAINIVIKQECEDGENCKNSEENFLQFEIKQEPLDMKEEFLEMKEEPLTQMEDENESDSDSDDTDQSESSESSDDGEFSNIKSVRARKQIKHKTKARAEILEKMKEKRNRLLGKAGKVV